MSGRPPEPSEKTGGRNTTGSEGVGEPVGDGVWSEVVGEPVGDAVGSEVVGEPVGDMVGSEVVGEIDGTMVVYEVVGMQSSAAAGSSSRLKIRRLKIRSRTSGNDSATRRECFENGRLARRHACGPSLPRL